MLDSQLSIVNCQLSIEKMDLFNYSRRETSEVNIGAVPLGGPNSIRVQSMTNTSTQDTEACVEQAKRIVDAGGEYVRLTTQGIKEAENLMNINIGLRSMPYPKQPDVLYTSHNLPNHHL